MYYENSYAMNCMLSRGLLFILELQNKLIKETSLIYTSNQSSCVLSGCHVKNPFSSWNISIQSPAIYQCLWHAKSLSKKQQWNCSWLFGLKSKSTDRVLEVIWVRILILILDLIMFTGFTDVSYYLKSWSSTLF